ncbi:MAG: PD40 domain-containing protein [Planctomycetes bacterium]|nr:PD40 domain-containing protein [Planctomycetota bacterium]
MAAMSLRLLPICLLGACASAPAPQDPLVPANPVTIVAGKPVPSLPNEPHLKNVRQLTFDGENAEAYWSNDGKRLIFQRRDRSMPADQIYTLDLTTGEQRMITTGKGRTTCSYFLQGDREVVFASTHHHGDAPPVVKMTGRGYQWAVHQEYDVFAADADGGNVRQLTDTQGYDAEATVDRVTGDIVFTSVRDGDLELYIMNADGSNVRRVTNRPGYDGGAFFSPDGSRLVLRSAFPKSAEQAAEDASLLTQQIVRPSLMEISVCNRDGSGFTQLTHNGAANFAPFWFPDGKRIIFASNLGGVEKAQKTQDRSALRIFNLYLMNDDGSGLEKVTDSSEFDSFPMFSPDGRYLVFASNRYGQQQGETNLFVAEWVD